MIPQSTVITVLFSIFLKSGWMNIILWSKNKNTYITFLLWTCLLFENMDDWSEPFPQHYFLPPFHLPICKYIAIIYSTNLHKSEERREKLYNWVKEEKIIWLRMARALKFSCTNNFILVNITCQSKDKFGLIHLVSMYQYVYHSMVPFNSVLLNILEWKCYGYYFT